MYSTLHKPLLFSNPASWPCFHPIVPVGNIKTGNLPQFPNPIQPVSLKRCLFKKKIQSWNCTILLNSTHPNQDSRKHEQREFNQAEIDVMKKVTTLSVRENISDQLSDIWSQCCSIRERITPTVKLWRSTTPCLFIQATTETPHTVLLFSAPSPEVMHSLLPLLEGQDLIRSSLGKVWALQLHTLL